MKQREVDAILIGDLGELFLSLVLSPRGHHLTSVFGGIGIADHDFLPAFAIVPIPVHAVERRHTVRGAAQVIQGLKEGHYPHRVFHTRFT